MPTVFGIVSHAERSLWLREMGEARMWGKYPVSFWVDRAEFSEHYTLCAHTTNGARWIYLEEIGVNKMDSIIQTWRSFLMRAAERFIDDYSEPIDVVITTQGLQFLQE